jgi:UDP-GlcNAc:undecaprenyl-phosphate GlcNAc-1-phosphate transferase
MIITPAAIAGAAALVAAAVITLPIAWLARRIGYLNAPNPIVKSHVVAVPYGGGAAVLLSLALGFACAARLVPAAPMPWGTLAGGAVMAAFGGLDDAVTLPPAIKFAGQVVGAAVALWLAFMPFQLGLGEGAVTLFATVAMLNAVNFLDVSDGFAASATIGAAGVLALYTGDILAAGLAGACTGFAIYNWQPAKLYLGDAGSHLLGFLLAVLALRLAAAAPAGSGFAGLLPAAAILAVPMFELVFVTGVRVARGIPWWRGSPDHVALRLQAMGYGRGAIALGAGALAGLIALASFAAKRLGGSAPIIAISLFAVIAIALTLRLLRVR